MLTTLPMPYSMSTSGASFSFGSTPTLLSTPALGTTATLEPVKSIHSLLYSRHKSTNGPSTTLGTYYRSTPVTPPTTVHHRLRSSSHHPTTGGRRSLPAYIGSTAGLTSSTASLAYSVSVFTPLSAITLAPTPRSERLEQLLGESTPALLYPALNGTSGFEPFEPELEHGVRSSNRAVMVAIILAAISIFTIVGNMMVIWAIFNYRPLHQVQNMYLVSLAVADIAVAVLVMPFNVVNNLLGKWVFGLHLCEMWLTSDVLCCTASILNLCAIALDRYWAIHDPINYAQKRTMRRVVGSIGIIWILSALISIPPLIGWNDWPEEFSQNTPCKLTEEKSYLIYSSSGSFFIPLVIMAVVYFKIFKATRRRLKDRAKASAMANLGAAMKSAKNSKCAIATVSGCNATAGVTTSACAGVGPSAIDAADLHNDHMKSVSHDDSSSSGSPQSRRATLSSSDLNSRKQGRRDSSRFNIFQSKCLCCCNSLYKTRNDHKNGDNGPESGRQHNGGSHKHHHHQRRSRAGLSEQFGSDEESRHCEQHRKASHFTCQPNSAKIEIESASDERAIHNESSSSAGEPPTDSSVHKNGASTRARPPTSSSTATAATPSTAKSSQVVTLLEPHSKAVRTDLVCAETPSGSDFSSKLPALTSSSGSGLPTAACPSTTTVSVKTIWEEKQKISLSRERRATRILGIVMGVFVACWLPFFLMYLIVPFCESCYVSPELESFITWLGYINSALNPLIYCGFNRDFRRAFQRILACKRV